MFLPVSRHTHSESAPGGPSVKKPKDLQRNFSVSEMTTTPTLPAKAPPCEWRKHLGHWPSGGVIGKNRGTRRQTETEAVRLLICSPTRHRGKHDIETQAVLPGTTSSESIQCHVARRETEAERLLSAVLPGCKHDIETQAVFPGTTSSQSKQCHVAHLGQGLQSSARWRLGRASISLSCVRKV